MKRVMRRNRQGRAARRSEGWHFSPGPRPVAGGASLPILVAGRCHRRAYALLDVVLAVALFAITVTGLLSVLRGIGDTSSGFARDRYIQQQIEGLLAEKRRLGIDAMVSESVDALTGITFRTYVEPFQIDNGEGAALESLYKLTAEATFLDDGGEQVEKAELILHIAET